MGELDTDIVDDLLLVIDFSDDVETVTVAQPVVDKEILEKIDGVMDEVTVGVGVTEPVVEAAAGVEVAFAELDITAVLLLVIDGVAEVEWQAEFVGVTVLECEIEGDAVPLFVGAVDSEKEAEAELEADGVTVADPEVEPVSEVLELVIAVVLEEADEDDVGEFDNVPEVDEVEHAEIVDEGDD